MGLAIETEILLSLVREPDFIHETGSFFWDQPSPILRFCLADDCAYLYVHGELKITDYQEMVRIFSDPIWRKKYRMERPDE